MSPDPTPPIPATDDHWISFVLSPGSVGRFLGIVIGILLVVGATVSWAIYHVAPSPDHPVADVLKRFDLGHEPSIPGFFSAVLILTTGGLLFVIGRDAWQRRDPRWRYWYLLAAGFFVMAVDEAVMFHEMLNTLMGLLIPAKGAFYFAWVIPALVLVVFLAMLFAGFVWSLPARTRWLFLVAGAMYVGGAVGMEMVAGEIFDAAPSYEAAVGSLAHVLEQAVEEGLEMSGIAVFLVALLELVTQQAAGFKFPVRCR